MANRKASIWLYVKTPAGWRYCKPVIGKNKGIKPGWAHVNSHEEESSRGTTCAGAKAKLCWESVGSAVPQQRKYLGATAMPNLLFPIDLGINVTASEGTLPVELPRKRILLDLPGLERSEARLKFRC